MTRFRLSRRARIRIYDRTKGICHICGQPIHAERGGKWEAHHKVPLWAGGADTEYNMVPVHCWPCHVLLSATDNGPRSKTDRQRANYLGIEKSGPKLPAGRKSPISKKVNGEVVARQPRYAKHHAMMARRYGEAT